MMDAVVQLVRNGLCTAKNFGLLSDTFLYDPTVTAEYYTFPSPLDKTTPLEVLIAFTQFYALVSLTSAGYGILARSGIGKLRSITRLLEKLHGKEKEDNKNNTDEKNKKKNETTTTAIAEKAARRIVLRSLLDESDVATRDTLVGFCVLVLGLTFTWLVANSFHVTETDWIGGTWGLIHALTAAEAALVVFLYYMVKDARGHGSRARRMEEFADKIASSEKKEGGSSLDVEKISVEEYGWLRAAEGGWSPFWASGGNNNSNATVAAEGRMLAKEEEAVSSRLEVLSSKTIGPEVVDAIRTEARKATFEGRREYLYLLLNALAFYGYLAGIVTAYYADEGEQPEHVRAMLMWMSNGDADWLGNAVGDFAWTVEPIVILGSPMMLAGYDGTKKKSKKKQEEEGKKEKAE